MNHEDIKEKIIHSLKGLGGSDIKFLNQILTLLKLYLKEKRDD